MTTSIDWVHEIDSSFHSTGTTDVYVARVRAGRWRLRRDAHAGDGFADYLLARQQHVRRVAHAICCDWRQAEGAVRETLALLETAWPHLADAVAADTFVHHALARLDVHDSPSPRSCGDACPDDFPIEDESLIFDCLQSLPAVQRKVLVLHDWLDLPAEEVAEALGIDVARLLHHATRGRAALEMLMHEPV